MRLLWLLAWLAFAASANPLISKFPRITTKIVERDNAPTATEMSSAVMETFSSIKRKEWSTGEEGLMGCTTFYIISRKGVYATHWWENVSFDPDDFWREPTTQTNEELFQSTVLDMLTSAGKYHPRLDADLIEEDYIRATSFTQRRLGSRIKVISATQNNPARWTDIPYTPVDEPEELDNDRVTKGRNLFKYDPAHDVWGGQT
ncbi:hypothetical protein BDV23DRAFT_177030 [Aspergillus alliaceus]|uniref:Uncharacterized protein n=1 Tax=Petromyces alliaceus TaxID=209559 RepID=A0A5N7BS95_PETAA|nr:hypothetical protein BDV23DRAFT_177030 [Aspergillus alliaceus]